MPWNDNANPGPWGAPPGEQDGDAGRGTGPRIEPPPRRESPPPERPDLQALRRRIDQRVARWLSRPARGAWRGETAAALLALAMSAWLATGVHIVQANQQAVVTRFGDFARLDGPGLHYHLPFPIEHAQPVAVTSENTTAVEGGDGSDPDRRLMLTGDEALVDLSFRVQWRVTDAAAYVFNIKNPDETVRAVAQSAMREVVGRHDLTSILAGGRQAAQDEAARILQTVLDGYHAGVAIDAVQIQSANPPSPVIAAWQDIAKAEAEAQTGINDANAYRAKAVGEARGEAARIVQGAQGYREQVVRYAQGQAAAFNQLYPEYRRAPAVTRERLYLETMERIVSHAHKVIIDGKAANAPLVLPPELFRNPSQVQVSPPAQGQGKGSGP